MHAAVYSPRKPGPLSSTLKRTARTMPLASAISASAVRTAILRRMAGERLLRIADQVVDHLPQLRRVTLDQRQVRRQQRAVTGAPAVR